MDNTKIAQLLCSEMIFFVFSFLFFYKTKYVFQKKDIKNKLIDFLVLILFFFIVIVSIAFVINAIVSFFLINEVYLGIFFIILCTISSAFTVLHFNSMIIGYINDFFILTMVVSYIVLSTSIMIFC